LSALAQIFGHIYNDYEHACYFENTKDFDAFFYCAAWNADAVLR